MFGTPGKVLHDAAGDRVPVTGRDLEHGHHQDLEALIFEAAAVQAGHGAAKEFDYVAHRSPFPRPARCRLQRLADDSAPHRRVTPLGAYTAKAASLPHASRIRLKHVGSGGEVSR
jgi:hypothetical protein